MMNSKALVILGIMFASTMMVECKQKIRHHLKKELQQVGTNWYNVGNCTQYTLSDVAKRFRPNDTFSCSEYQVTWDCQLRTDGYDCAPHGLVTVIDPNFFNNDTKPYNPYFLYGSNISLSDSDKRWLFKQINGTRIGSYNIFNANRDGWTPFNFHNATNYNERVITLWQAENGRRFGGYSYLSWQSPAIWTGYHDYTAFIFSIDNQQVYPVIPGRYALFCYEARGPAFGLDQELFWMGSSSGMY